MHCRRAQRSRARAQRLACFIGSKSGLDEGRAAFAATSAVIAEIKQLLEAAQVHTERDALAVELRDREQELSDSRALSDALKSGLDEGRAAFAATSAVIAEIKQLLTETMANREHTMAVEFEKLNSRLEQARAALCSSERARGQEVEELRAQLASLGDQHAKLLEKYESAELLLANVQARNDKLTAEQEQLAAMYQEKLESERLEREKLASELAGLRRIARIGRSSGPVAFGCTSGAGRSKRGARLDRRPPWRAGFTKGFRVIRLSASHDG